MVGHCGSRVTNTSKRRVVLKQKCRTRFLIVFCFCCCCCCFSVITLLFICVCLFFRLFETKAKRVVCKSGFTFGQKSVGTARLRVSPGPPTTTRCCSNTHKICVSAHCSSTKIQCSESCKRGQLRMTAMCRMWTTLLSRTPSRRRTVGSPPLTERGRNDTIFRAPSWLNTTI